MRPGELQGAPYVARGEGSLASRDSATLLTSSPAHALSRVLALYTSSS